MSFWKNNQSDIFKISIGAFVGIVAFAGKTIFDGKGFDYLTLVIIITLVLLIFYAINLYVLYKMQTKFSIEKIAKVIDEYRANHELQGSAWYFNMEQLEKFEFEDYIENTDNFNKEIWVVSSCLEHDHPDSHLHAKIKENVTKFKVKYKYIVPNRKDDRLLKKTERLHDEFVTEYKQYNPFIVITDEAFDYPCDILIFKHSDKNSITVFMELRVTEKPEERKWAKIENSSARRIYLNINSDISNNNMCIPFEESVFQNAIHP